MMMVEWKRKLFPKKKRKKEGWERRERGLKFIIICWFCIQADFRSLQHVRREFEIQHALKWLPLALFLSLSLSLFFISFFLLISFFLSVLSFSSFLSLGSSSLSFISSKENSLKLEWKNVKKEDEKTEWMLRTNKRGKDTSRVNCCSWWSKDDKFCWFLWICIHQTKSRWSFLSSLFPFFFERNFQNFKK